MRRVFIVAVIILILLGILAYSVFNAHDDATPASSIQSMQQYANPTYGYSIQYPAQYTIDEESPQYVVVGTKDDQTFNGVAEIDAAFSEASSTYGDFDDFAQAQASLDCDANGPDENISCPSIQSSESFTAQSGITGEEFYFNEVTSGNSGESTTAFGPFFAFDISGNTPQENAQFSALIIRPLISSTSTDPATIEAIANSLQFTATN